MGLDTIAIFILSDAISKHSGLGITVEYMDSKLFNVLHYSSTLYVGDGMKVLISHINTYTKSQTANFADRLNATFSKRPNSFTRMRIISGFMLYFNRIRTYPMHKKIVTDNEN